LGVVFVWRGSVGFLFGVEWGVIVLVCVVVFFGPGVWVEVVVDCLFYLLGTVGVGDELVGYFYGCLVLLCGCDEGSE